MAEKKDKRASILPQVEKVLLTPRIEKLMKDWRRDAVVRVVRRVIDNLRKEVASGKRTEPASAEDVASMSADELASLEKVHPSTVINGTGIILHTNLGRSIISKSAREALLEAAGSYCDLEVDMTTGDRTRRDIHLEKLLCTLFDCEAATVVNNCAAAVMITLNTLAAGKEVITSRGELVEIGGSFRVPDVVAKSGAFLREVGTTNRVKASDYESAIGVNTALILKTHTSNYRVVGFHAEVETSDLATLGKNHDIPVVVDLGSGHVPRESGDSLDEPDVASTLAEGPDVVTFSGDKLLFGPQAGIAIGSKRHIDAIRKNPLWRVVRIDKLAASALYATLIEHLRGSPSGDEGEMSWLLARSTDEKAKLADELHKKIRNANGVLEIEIIDGPGSFGGGSVPGWEIESKMVTIHHPEKEPAEVDDFLRNGDPPVAGYFHKGKYVINVLALLPGDIEKIAGRLGAFE